jgi:hypothetical protein
MFSLYVDEVYIADYANIKEALQQVKELLDAGSVVNILNISVGYHE